MSYTQDFFTSRNSQSSEEKIGQEGRLWYDPVSNSIRVGDGKTIGGLFVGTGAPYQLPIATSSTLGGVKIDGTTIVVNPETGEISSITGDAYILRPATATTLGGVTIGENLNVDSAGVLSAFAYTLPTASADVIGGVKVDDSTITINENGTISALQYSLPTASNNVIGGIKIGSGLIINSDGQLSTVSYELPTASSVSLGGIKVDNSTIKIDNDGYISYTLPTASALRLGGVKIGKGLAVDDGLISTDSSWISAINAGPGIRVLPGADTVTISSRIATTAVLGSVTVDNSTIVVNQVGRISVTTDGIVGTVKSVSVNSANGFTGEVSSASTYPTITLGTYVNGITKGVNGALLSAEANIDYQAPISLTTNNITGPSTFTNNILNIPVYQGKLTLQTAGIGGAATLVDDVLNIPQYGSVTSVRITSDDITIDGTNPVTRSGTINLNLNTVPVNKGGTGRTKFDAGYLISDGFELSSATTINASNIVGDIAGKSSSITEVLPISLGGTGTTTALGAASALLPNQTGNANKFLSTDGEGILSWAVVELDPSVKSVSVSGGNTGLTTSGGPVTGANNGIGTITLDGVLKVSNGGTGATLPATARENLEAAKSGANSDITSLSGLTTPLSVEQGGTSATNPADARTFLVAAKSGANSDITSLSGLTTPLSVAQGGTGSSTGSGARDNLSAAKSGANSDITSLTGLNIPLSVTQGGTGSVTIEGARVNLEAAKSGANSDITSLSGLTTALSISQGGTGATLANDARINLIGAKSGANSDITSLSGLTTPLSVEQGGTGSSSAADALNSLLPSQAGNSSKYLTTNGTIARWALVRPAAVGADGQLQFNNANFLAGTDRIFYDGRGQLTVGEGSTELFRFVGAGARDRYNGGTTVEIKGGDSFNIEENALIPAAGNVFLTAGRGLGDGDPGYVAIKVGDESREVFRVNPTGSWSFNGSSNGYGEEGQVLVSNGNILSPAGTATPSWKSIPVASTTVRGIIKILETGSGLEFVPGPADTVEKPDPVLKAVLTDVDDQTILKDDLGVLRVNIDFVAVEILPPQDGQDKKYLSTNGSNTSWSEIILPMADYDTLGGVRLDESSIQIGPGNRIFVDIDSSLPDQTFKAGWFLSTNGENAFWENIESTLPLAGASEFGLVKIDNNTIKINPSGAIAVDLVAVLPAVDPSLSNDRYLSYVSNDSGDPFFYWGDPLTKQASITELGSVKIDGSTITIVPDGTISANINALLPPQSPKPYSVLATNGQSLFWNETSYILPPATNTILGGIKTDNVTTFTDQTGVLSVSGLKFIDGIDKSLAFNNNGVIDLTDSLRYDDLTTTLLFGSTSTRQVPVTLEAINGSSLTIKTNDAPAGGRNGNITIRAGKNSAAAPGSGGIITIKAGDGDSSGSGRITGGDIIVDAGAGHPSTADFIPPARGGDIVFRTAGTAETQTTDRFRIRGDGSWGLGPATFISPDPDLIQYDIGAVGQPLLSSGAGTIPQWGETIDILYGGTGAKTRENAINNLLPPQEGNNNYILVTNGDFPSWVPLTQSGLLPIATTSNLGTVIVDGTSINVTQEGIISVITGDAVGTVNSVQFDTGTTGLTVSGGPITSTGTFTLDGILEIKNGGTGSDNATDAINKLLPKQTTIGISTSGQSLLSDGEQSYWGYPEYIIASGEVGNLLFNNNNVSDGTPNLNYAGDSLILGKAGGEVSTFNIYGADGKAGLDPIGIIIRPGLQPNEDRAGADIYLSGGPAQGDNTPGGSVYIDGGISEGASGGNIVFRTAFNAGDSLVERLAIDNSGSWIIGGNTGFQNQVITSNGSNQAPTWKFPVLNADGLTGETLTSSIVNSSLTQVGTLNNLNVAGKVGIGTTTPQAPLSVSRGNSDVGIEFNPSISTEASSIKTINRLNNQLTDLSINASSISFVTSNDSETSNINVIKILSTGSIEINGNSGTTGLVLTSNGADAAPSWSSAAPNYEELVAISNQTVFSTIVETKSNDSAKSYLQVFVNGVLQREGSTKSYLVTGVNEITFNQGLQSNDEISIYSFA